MRIGRVPIGASCGVTSARDMVRSLCAVFICCLCISAPFARAADSLDTAFARIDQAAKTFKGLTADITNTAYTAVVDNKDVQTGTLKLLPAKDGTHVLLNFKGGQTISFTGHKLRVYNPTTNVVDEKDIDPNMVDQFRQLGFGATSAQIKANYDVAYAGAEQIGNEQTSHITLVPKSPETRRDMKQAELWIGANGLAVQQKILRPDGDYQLMTYTHMTTGAVAEKDLELKLRSDTKFKSTDSTSLLLPPEPT